MPHAAVQSRNHAVLRGTAAVDGVLEGVGREARCHRVRRAPSEDLLDEEDDDESSLSLRHRGLRIGGVGGPKLAKTVAF